jgi:hypothetical protein
LEIQVPIEALAVLYVKKIEVVVKAFAKNANHEKEISYEWR